MTDGWIYVDKETLFQMDVMLYCTESSSMQKMTPIQKMGTWCLQATIHLIELNIHAKFKQIAECMLWA
jgi:hypothetical protein